MLLTILANNNLNVPTSTAGQTWMMWTNSPRPPEPEPEVVRTDHGRLHQFRTGFQTVGQPLWLLYWKTTNIDTGDQVGGPRGLQSDLHAYRPGYQTVGQPWFALRPTPKALPIDAEAIGPQPLPTVHSFRPGFQTVGQPWFALTAIPKGLPTDAEPISPQPLPSVHSFRTGYQTVGQPIWSLYWKTTNVDTGDQLGGPRGLQSDLHLYRVGFQTVGQPWFVLQPPKQRQIEPEAQYSAQISYSLLFGRAGIAATVVGQPWYLWIQPKRFLEPEDEPYRVDHGRMHQFRTGFQTVGQPTWALFWKSNIPDVTDATVPQYPLHDRLHRYRTGYQTVGQGAWPLFWKSNIQDVSNLTAPVYPSANNLHLYRVGFQTVGQPAFLLAWKSSLPDFPDVPMQPPVRNEATHIYRVGYQTVGQTILAYWKPTSNQLDPPQEVRLHDYSEDFILFQEAESGGGPPPPLPKRPIVINLGLSLMRLGGQVF